MQPFRKYSDQNIAPHRKGALKSIAKNIFAIVFYAFRRTALPLEVVDRNIFAAEFIIWKW